MSSPLVSMASAEFCSLDLPMDNFDLLELLSVPFPLGSGDLNLMARRSGLLDTPSQASDVGTYLACQPYPVHCVTETQGPLAQAQQLQFQIPNVCPVKASDYACHSQSAIPQPSFPQPSVSQPAANQQTISQQLSTTAFSAKQSDVPPPQHSAHIGTPTQCMQTPFARVSNQSFDRNDSQQRAIKADQPDTHPSNEQSDLDDSYAATPRRSTRKRQATEASNNDDLKQEWLQQKKKVGRPITYKGDPNAPELTEAERRRVKRRNANRESARRVQQRRKEMIDELQHKLLYVQHHHQHLMHYLARLEMDKGQLAGQLTDVKGKWAKSCADNIALTTQLQNLQQHHWQHHGCQQNGPEPADQQQSWDPELYPHKGLP